MDPIQSDSDYRLFLKTLRRVAKARKFTSARIASELKVSEVTVKRWFTGHACSLETVFRICEIVDVSFFDIASLTKEDEELDYVLSNEQELFFSQNPGMFGLFKQLHRGEDPETVREHWGLNKPQLYRVLRKLEKLELLEVLPNDRIRMKVRGNIRYSHRGPLAKAVLRPQIIQFLDHVDKELERDDVCMHSAEVLLSETHLGELVREIHELGSKYRTRAYRDQSLLSSEKLRPVRWLLALAPYQTDWRQYSQTAPLNCA